MNRIKKFWLRLFMDKNEDYVKSQLLCYLHNSNILFADWQITNITVRTWLNKITVTIHAQRPGFVIGRAGNTVNGIKRYLNGACPEQVRVKVKESDIWRFRNKYHWYELRLQKLTIKRLRKYSSVKGG